jgi:hypothetical protein
MEKWVKNTMPKSGSKIVVNPRIKRAVDNGQLGLSEGRPVLRYNSYFNSYKAEELPLIKNKKQVYKTHCLDKSNGHYINYGLRAAVLGLLHAAKTEDNLETHLVTVDLNSDFSKKITSVAVQETLHSISIGCLDLKSRCLCALVNNSLQ